MKESLNSAEQGYLLVDSIYRVHRDLFEVENVISQSARLQYELAKLNLSSRLGATIAGLIGIFSMLVSIYKIDLNSVPTYCIAAITVGLLLFWIYQISKAEDAKSKFAALEHFATPTALPARMDYVLEELNAWIVRHKAAERVRSEIELLLSNSQVSTEFRSELVAKMKRYSLIQDDCAEEVDGLVKLSEEMVKKSLRSEVDHKLIMEWAAALPKYNTVT